MKTMFLIFALMPAPAMAVSVFYDTTTLNVAEWGYAEPSQVMSMNSNYGFIHVVDHDPILKIPVKYLKYDQANNCIVRISDGDVLKLDKKIRKEEIRKDIRSLRIQYFNALQERTEGFDVSEETATLKNRIDILKSEYQNISGN